MARGPACVLELHLPKAAAPWPRPPDPRPRAPRATRLQCQVEVARLSAQLALSEDSCATLRAEVRRLTSASGAPRHEPTRLQGRYGHAADEYAAPLRPHVRCYSQPTPDPLQHEHAKRAAFRALSAQLSSSGKGGLYF